MSEEKLFVIQGSGPDGIGLVGKITKSLAGAGANILDLRQDVLHGLFIIYLVADFTGRKISLEECQNLVKLLAQDTNLFLRAERFYPQARDPHKKNLLLILVGRDQPGLASVISSQLSYFQVNIEFSKMIAREGLFLMELLVDISHSTVPLINLEKELQKLMTSLQIELVIQRDAVFNKKPRLVVFSPANSLLPINTIEEIFKQINLEASKLEALAKKTWAQRLALLEDLPEEILNKVLEATKPTADTQELIQTLKTFGYQLVLYGPYWDRLVLKQAELLGLDAACGFELPLDADTRRISLNQLEGVKILPEAKFIEAMREKFNLTVNDVTIIRQAGFKIMLDYKPLLELYNKHALSAEKFLGLLACFGVFAEKV